MTAPSSPPPLPATCGITVRQPLRSDPARRRRCRINTICSQVPQCNHSAPPPVDTMPTASSWCTKFHQVQIKTRVTNDFFSFSHLRVVKCFALPHPLQVASQELISDESKADTKTQTESGSSFFDSIPFLGVYYYFCKLSQPSSLISLCQFLKVWWCRE